MVLLSQQRPAATRAPRNGVVLAVLCVAAFMAALDVFIVNVAFASIGRDFRGTPLAQLSWVLSAYAIVYAALLVPLGRVADRFGRREGFLLGLAVFTAASAACALSADLWMLVAFRVLQAVGAALLTPTSLGLVLQSATPERRARSVRIWASTGAVAAAAGPVVGGLLVEASWRWVFLVNVPVGVLALVAAARVLPRSAAPEPTPLPDLVGAVLVAVGIGALTLGVVEGSSWGWDSARTLTAFAVAVAGVAGFAVRITHHPVPVVEPALLRVRAFAWANVTVLVFSLGFAASLLAVILWMQDVWAYSALRTGLAITPGPVMVPIAAALAQRVSARVKVGHVVALGCVLSAVGTLLVLHSVGPEPDYATAILPGWILGGIGFGLALPSILSAATADLPADRSATGSAVVNMSRQVGTVLGVSILVAVIGTPHGYAASHAAFVHGWWVCVLASALAAGAALGMTPRRAGGSA